jgi:hypothetical protein
MKEKTFNTSYWEDAYKKIVEIWRSYSLKTFELSLDNSLKMTSNGFSQYKNWIDDCYDRIFKNISPEIAGKVGTPVVEWFDSLEYRVLNLESKVEAIFESTYNPKLKKNK